MFHAKLRHILFRPQRVQDLLPHIWYHAKQNRPSMCTDVEKTSPERKVDLLTFGFGVSNGSKMLNACPFMPSNISASCRGSVTSKFFVENVICPGLCPECLGNAELPSAQRMHQFLNVTEWKAHIGQHVPQLPGPFRCLHPRCHQVPPFDDLNLFIAHRADIHQIRINNQENSRRVRATSRPCRARRSLPRKPASLDSESGEESFEFIHHTADTIMSRRKSKEKGTRPGAHEVVNTLPVTQPACSSTLADDFLALQPSRRSLRKRRVPAPSAKARSSKRAKVSEYTSQGGVPLLHESQVDEDIRFTSLDRKHIKLESGNLVYVKYENAVAGGRRRSIVRLMIPAALSSASCSKVRATADFFVHILFHAPHFALPILVQLSPVPASVSNFPCSARDRQGGRGLEGS